MDTVRTFCRICEPSCGLVADVDGGQLVKLTPDREHPVIRVVVADLGRTVFEHTDQLIRHPPLDRSGRHLGRSAGGLRPRDDSLLDRLLPLDGARAHLTPVTP